MCLHTDFLMNNKELFATFSLNSDCGIHAEQARSQKGRKKIT